MPAPISILLLGSGGREHALAWKLARSPRCGALHAAPGNPGIARHATLANGLTIDDGAAVVAYARTHAVSLVVIGPEAPLAAGVADACRAAGIAVFGPSAAAARLEASKAFTKLLCDEANVPTARYRSFSQLDEALAYTRAQSLPVVVKADGLAAGKGVTVADSHAAAQTALQLLFAEPGASVVIEECMVGEEVSFFVLADGTTALPLLAVQDHKRIGEGDTGPNTGGMGAYAPARAFTPQLQAATMQRIILPTLAAMQQRGTPFCGVLFAGLMLTGEGPKLIEYNVRFGDPECQVLMALLESDLVELLLACATGRLATADLRWAPGAAAAVVVAARGYPGAAATGGNIAGLDAAERQAHIFQAGTALVDGRLVASGGRVLTATATGADVTAAAATAYAAIEKLRFADGVYRRDIGHREIAREAAAGEKP